ncbi:MAG: hypothetical protein KF688_02810 [Pirellulales bacterium]|nr:hypothetical protein [Pirellulales bacterium]
MLRIEFSNSKDKPVFVQVDPWACLYKLEKGERIEFAVEATSDEPFFSIDDYDEENRILTLDSEEFFIVRDGQRVHWEEYQTNV